MRCLFCKASSDTAKSVEHIVPESMGNRRHSLPPGAVCDSCNNYFAHSLEGPLLSHPSLRNLRAWYQVPSKKGKMPYVLGRLYGTDIEVGMRVGKDKTPELRPERESDIPEIERFIRQEAAADRDAAFFFTQSRQSPPQKEMSRLLAKMALEALCQRFFPDLELLDLLIDEPHYDRIRNFARRGTQGVVWPYRERRIYPEETQMRHPETGEWVQAGFGYDVFMTRSRETYFAFCYYGIEYVTNIGGPSLVGFDQWLSEFSDASPLILRHGRQLVNNPEKPNEFRLLEGPSETAAIDFDRLLLDQ